MCKPILVISVTINESKKFTKIKKNPKKSVKLKKKIRTIKKSL